jgi:hypothetical protein
MRIFLFCYRRLWQFDRRKFSSIAREEDRFSRIYTGAMQINCVQDSCEQWLMNKGNQTKNRNLTMSKPLGGADSIARLPAGDAFLS